MKIGLLMGSFDPPHLGHIETLKKLKEDGVFEDIWFIPTPQNPGKHWDATPLQIREEMLEACGVGHTLITPPEDLPSLMDPDGKFYSYRQLDYVKTQLVKFYSPQRPLDLYIIHGQDINPFRWRHGSVIKRNFKSYQVDRSELPISSTDIRAMIAAHDPNVTNYLDPSTLGIIKRESLYGV